MAFGDIEAVKAAIGPETAAILIEPIQGEGGVRPVPHAFMRELRALCDADGLLLILDEIQCGMGRTGTLFAHEQAGSRGLDVHFEVMDVVELPHEGKPYDLIVDSYCLQGIVTDSDRERLFAAIRARLKPEGYYVVSTAYFEESRCHRDKTVIDEPTGRPYHGYDESCLFDPAVDIVYSPIGQEHDQWADSIRIAGQWYLPIRRHRRPDALKTELTTAGFGVLHQDKGNLVCAEKGAGVVF